MAWSKSFSGASKWLLNSSKSSSSTQGTNRLARFTAELLGVVLATVAVVPMALFLLGRSVALEGLPTTQAHYLTNPIHHAYADAGIRIRTALVVWAFAIYKLLFPFHLSFDYGANTFALVQSMGDWRLWGSMVVLLGTLAIGVRCLRRQQWLVCCRA